MGRYNNYDFDFDLSRVCGMMAFSFFYNGPANALIYPWYHKVFGANVNRCLLFDQIFYMPCCAIPACWYFNGVFKKWIMAPDEHPFVSVDDPSPTLRKSLEETTSEMKENWVDNVLCTMAIWIPAESINMRFTPVYLRAVVAGTTSFFWTTGMAVWTHVIH